MKKKLLFPCIIFIIIYILCIPQSAVEAAADGLILWYEKILPSLLPFVILSNFLIQSSELSFCITWLHKFSKHILPTSTGGTFVLLTGFLFGFPMGSKNCAELLRNGQIDLAEANILFAITNNISPVFINSYILLQQLKQPSLFLGSLALIYGPPLIYGAFQLQALKSSSDGYLLSNKKTASRSKINFQIIDAGIMNGFETLCRIGGYIMLFSIIVSMIKHLPLPQYLQTFLVGTLEITNGIEFLTTTIASEKLRYIFAMTFTAFGGLCGIAQTASMIRNTGLSIVNYVKTKLLLTACTTALSCIAAFCMYK